MALAVCGEGFGEFSIASMLIVQLQSHIQLIRSIARQLCKATASGFEPCGQSPMDFEIENAKLKSTTRNM